MAGYFKDLYLGVTTVIAGMQVTFRHLFEKNITIQYPRVVKEMYPRARARLVNTISECECCYKCQRICPVNIFTITGIRAGKDEDLGLLSSGKPRQMHILEFDIDFAKCVYCGLCVDVCETQSLHWESPQEVCTFTRGEMRISFADMPEEEKQRLLKQEEEKKAARAAAAAAKAAAGDAKPVPKKLVVKKDGEGEATTEDKT
jgi:NADH-quinone oxidoreductase subunit I